VLGRSVSVKVNDELGHFQTKLGLRQGDPLSPILFNILVDILAVLIKRSKDQDLIGGLVPI
jgi:retron-type reverse transcriptase